MGGSYMLRLVHIMIMIIVRAAGGVASIVVGGFSSLYYTMGYDNGRWMLRVVKASRGGEGDFTFARRD